MNYLKKVIVFLFVVGVYSPLFSQTVKIYVAPYNVANNLYDTARIRATYLSAGFSNVALYYGPVDASLTKTNFDVAFVAEFYEFDGTNYVDNFLTTTQAAQVKSFIQAGGHVVWSAENWLIAPTGNAVAQQTNMLTTINSIWNVNVINSPTYWSNMGIGPNSTPRTQNNNGPGGLSVNPDIESSGSYSVFNNVPTFNAVYAAGAIAATTFFDHCSNVSVLMFPAFPQSGQGTLIGSGEVGYNFSSSPFGAHYDVQTANLHYKLLTNDAAGLAAINNWTTIGPVLDTIKNFQACDSITVNGKKYFSSTTVIDTFDFGCPFYIKNNITINHSVVQNSSASICNGDSLLIGGICRKTSGVYSETYTTTKGCDSLIAIQLTVNPKPTANAGADVTIKKGETATLTASGGGSYLWSGNAIVGNNNLATITVNPNEQSTYTVLVTNTFGCIDSARVVVNVNDPNVSIFLPTAFSPNGDGKNDTFKIVSNQSFKFFSMNIYNRWGELVYSNNDLYNGWDGKFKGTDQPTGVYIVYIKATPYTGNEINNMGSLTLIK